MIPRVGEPVERNRRYRIRPGAYAILVRNGQVLLTHQQEPRPEFQLPGGGAPGQWPRPDQCHRLAIGIRGVVPADASEAPGRFDRGLHRPPA